MIGVFNRVGLGLFASAVMAYLTSSAPAVRDLLFVTAPDTRALVGLTPLGVLTALSPVAAIVAVGMGSEVTARRARLLYWTVVVTIGASLGVMFLAYAAASVATAFAASAAGFGALSLWGYSTKRDLNASASFWISGLVGLPCVMVLNLLLRSPAVGFAVNALGVVIFAGLIAYDTQCLKTCYRDCRGDPERLRAAADIGALNLYLDFINFLQFLLAFIGGRR
jgi:FtsH-binding integral membrane protein